MPKTKKPTGLIVAKFLTIRWKCSNCDRINTWPVAALSGVKHLNCLDCFYPLRIKIILKQFAYHYNIL